MVAAPSRPVLAVCRIHVIIAWLFLALFRFSRMGHAGGAPVWER
ncbi:MAG: hypothetical protein ACR2LJ_01550 [Acidimicrobiales bacterium]